MLKRVKKLKAVRANRKSKIIVIGIVAMIGASALIFSFAATDTFFIEPETSTLSGNAVKQADSGASGGNYVLFQGCPAGQIGTPPNCTTSSSNYDSNLAMIKAATYRNRNHDSSPFMNTPSAQLPTDANSPLLGPRTDYLNNPGNNPENHFSNLLAGDKDDSGEFRVACEFSHFSYDDPLVYPNQPGKAHLHMYFGNTNVNAYSNYNSLINTGSSTCNGQELNRTGYWVPAVFDAQGNVRVPERVVLYYKGYGRAMKGVTDSGQPVSEGAEMYPEGMAIVAMTSANERPSFQGDGIGYNYMCGSNVINGAANWELGYDNSADRTIPVCTGYGKPGDPLHRTLLIDFKFPNCWNGQDPSNWSNFNFASIGGWAYSDCQRSSPFTRVFPNLEYFVHYPLEEGETTAGWYLSSDIDKNSFAKNTPGSTIHADWWGGWNKTINRTFLDNCVHIDADCGFGYLSDGGDNRNSDPLPGPALRFRPQYTGPIKVPASTLFKELCPGATRQYSKPEDAAWCRP